MDAETEEFLRQEAEDRFEGNVSRLVTALAREEMSRRAAEWLLVHSRNYKPMTVEETRAFLAKFTQTRKRRKKSAAA